VLRLLDKLVDIEARSAPEKLREVLDEAAIAHPALRQRADFRRLQEFAASRGR
jgi:hypothetical protein